MRAFLKQDSSEDSLDIKLMKNEFCRIKDQFEGIMDGHNLLAKDIKLTADLLMLINYGGAIDNISSFAGNNRKKVMRNFRMS
mgnify:CR=1 FL=1